MEVPLEKDKSKKILKVENTIYAYSKFRSTYGRWCIFHDHDTEVNIDIQPDENASKMYENMSQIERGTQACPQISFKEINTSHIKNTTTGINHVEGGWPKDISYSDQEQTIRYRKKAEREESYIPTMQNLCKLMEECIEQNNSIDIYVRYFAKEPVLDYHPEVSATVAINMRDPSGQNRAVSCVSWHPMDSTDRILVAHCDLDFMEAMKPCNDSYIWWVENPFQPEHVLSATSPMLTMECNYKDINLIAGGQHNGQVVFFDIRKSVKPVGLTEKPMSHLEPVHSLIWIQSKTGFECFTTSTDGQVLWWDMRNLNESTDQMVIDHTKNNDMETSEGGVVLEYCNTVPTKFMVGTEKGNVYSCTRKAKTPADKLGQVFSEHIGPVYLLQRNPYLYKLFLTVGDYHANIWAEDFAHAPIWKTPLYNTHVLHGGWSPPRPSVFFVTKADGTFDVWDLMYRQKGPEYSLKLTDKRLFCMSVQEKGEFVAVGSETGVTYVLQMSSEVFEPQGGEKNFFLIERESRREKFLYDKEKDRKLAKAGRISQPQEISKEMEDIKEILEKTTENFIETIAEEMKRLEKYRKYPQQEIQVDKSGCEEDELGEEMEEFLVEAPTRIMPEDKSLPLYQVESFALEGSPDQPMDMFQGTIYKKRFRIGHCADIPYPPEQDIDFRMLTTCDCPAIMPQKSPVDEEAVAEPVITRVEPGKVFIGDYEEPPPEEKPPPKMPSMKSSSEIIHKSRKIYLDDISLSSVGDNQSWEETKIRRARVEDSVDITSFGFRDSQAHTGLLIGGAGIIKLGTEAPAGGEERRSTISGLQAAKIEEGLHSNVALSRKRTLLPKASQPTQPGPEGEAKESGESEEMEKSIKKSSLRSETKKLSLPEEQPAGQEDAAESEKRTSRRKTIQFKEAESVVPPISKEGDEVEEASAGPVEEEDVRPSQTDEFQIEALPLVPEEWLPPLNELTGETILEASVMESFQPPSEFKRTSMSIATTVKDFGMSIKTSVDSSDREVKRPSMSKDVDQKMSTHTEELEVEAEQALLEAISEVKK